MKIIGTIKQVETSEVCHSRMKYTLKPEWEINLEILPSKEEHAITKFMEGDL